ncbi:MAG TPA: hypothetical protein VFJ24_01645 [Gaiellales bacterium]|nr:hypothetical protein [Gaiellales bacterium]
MGGTLKIRSPEPADVALVCSTWKRSARLAYPWMRTTAYYRDHGAAIEAALARSSVLVACEADDPGHVYGWICWEGRCVHYVFVKYTYRAMGIGTALLLATGLVRREGGRLAGALQASHYSASHRVAANAVKAARDRGVSVEIWPHALHGAPAERRTA